MTEDDVEKMADQLFGKLDISMDDLTTIAIAASEFVRGELDAMGVDTRDQALALLKVFLMATAQTQAAFSTPASLDREVQFMSGVATVIRNYMPEEVH